MKLKQLKLAPALIALTVIALVCLLRVFTASQTEESPPTSAFNHPFDFLDRLERMTYDMRVRAALHFPFPASTNLGFVLISDNTVKEVERGLLGKPYGLYWPRHIYGRLIRELSAQKAKLAAFDILFFGLRPDQSPVPISTTKFPEALRFLSTLHPESKPVTYQSDGEEWVLVDSDDYFAWQLYRAHIGVLAAEKGVLPENLFGTNALGVADISADRDSDGVLRRVKAFWNYREWHPVFQQAEKEFNLDLQHARIEPGQIILPQIGTTNVFIVPIDSETNFNLANILGNKIPAGWPAKAKVFTEHRIWHMGVVIAARELGLDLTHADVNLNEGRIVLQGPDGLQRVLPVDRAGYLFINWELPFHDPRIFKEPVEDLLRQDMARSAGKTNNLEDNWQDKLAVVGSMTAGNDLTDRGATPLDSDTLFVSEHWNVANSIIMNRFVRRSSLTVDLLLIVGMGILAAFITWRLRALVAFALVGAGIVGYVGLSVMVYVKYRYWLPIVLPVGGALLLTHVCLVTWRVVFEQAERRRVRSIFSRIVSPDIVTELLGAEKLSLGGARREVTVLFADVRGFTQFTDANQEQAAAYIAEHKLSDEAAKAFEDEQARETLDTVNSYLALVADMVKKHIGTLDKYIGDCVMAFWGAPTPNPKHGSDCVRGAIDAQRAVYELNRQRFAENKNRELENLARVSAGLAPKPMLPILLIGSGINTGMVTVGLMGSEAHLSNYTVFGREVNLASRLETSSRSRPDRHQRSHVSETAKGRSGIG